MRSRVAVIGAVLLLGPGCTTNRVPDVPATPTPSPPPPSGVVDPGDPLATAEPDSAGVVVLRSRVVLDDGPGDVWQLAPVRVRAKVPPIDVHRAVVSVRADAVRVRSRFVDVRPVGRATYDVGLRTPDGLFYVDIVSGPRTRTGRVERFVAPTGDEVDCPGLTFDVDAADDLVTVDVPLRCVDDPPWVAARLLVSLRAGSRSYEENPHNHRPFSEFFSEPLYPSD